MTRNKDDWTFEEWVENTGGCPCDSENYTTGDCPEHDSHIPERWMT